MYFPGRRTALSSGRTIKPSDIAGLQYWFDADDPSTITQAAFSVSAWADKSGNGRTASQGNGAKQPILTPGATPSGKPALVFDGIDDYLATGSFTFNFPVITPFIVFRRITNASNDTILAQAMGAAAGYDINMPNGSGGDAEAGDLMYRGDGWNAGQHPKIVVQTPSVTSDSLYHQCDAALHSGTVAAYMDGAIQATRYTGSASAASMTGAVYIASISTASDFTNCGIAEIFVFGTSTPLQDSELVGLRKYLKRKWGTP